MTSHPVVVPAVPARQSESPPPSAAVLAARQEALAWVAQPVNTVRLGAYLSSYAGARPRSRDFHGRTLTDFTTLLRVWGVPGVEAPADVGALAASQWSRSVTLAVLRHLRENGHLR